MVIALLVRWVELWWDSSIKHFEKCCQRSRVWAEGRTAIQLGSDSWCQKLSFTPIFLYCSARGWSCSCEAAPWAKQKGQIPIHVGDEQTDALVSAIGGRFLEAFFKCISGWLEHIGMVISSPIRYTTLWIYILANVASRLFFPGVLFQSHVCKKEPL